MKAKHFKIVFGTLVVISSAVAFIFTPHWLVKGRRGGTILFFMALLPMLIVYTLGFLYVLRKKRRESLLLSKMLAKNDPVWDLQPILQQIEKIFSLLQKAIQDQNISLLQLCVSDRLINNLNHLLKQEQTATQYLVYEGVVLGECTVVGINDYREDNKDSLWATVSYRMKKYAVARETRRPVERKPLFKQEYNELWKLSYHSENGWILEDRYESIKLSQLLSFQSFSESYPRQPEEPICVEIGKAVADYEWILQKSNSPPVFPSINSPIVALMIGLLAPWAIVLIFFLRIFYGG